MTKTIKFPGTGYIGDLSHAIRKVEEESKQEGYVLIAVCIRRIHTDGRVAVEFISMPCEVAPSKAIIVE